MQIMSVQYRIVVSHIMHGGIFYADPLHSPHLYSLDDPTENLNEGFVRGYTYMMDKMKSIGIIDPLMTTPIWGWYAYPSDDPSLSDLEALVDSTGEDDMVLLLDVPDDLVLLSDFDGFHCVLNGYAATDLRVCQCDIPEVVDEEWNLCPDCLESINMDDPGDIKKSWVHIFDIDALDKDAYIQAVFPRIETEWVIKVIDR